MKKWRRRILLGLRDSVIALMVASAVAPGISTGINMLFLTFFIVKNGFDIDHAFFEHDITLHILWGWWEPKTEDWLIFGMLFGYPAAAIAFLARLFRSREKQENAL